MKQFVTCFVNDEALAIDIQTVQEITAIENLTPVQRAPEMVRGLINIRGQVITIIELNVSLKLGKSNDTDSSDTIILKPMEQLKRLGVLPSVEGAEGNNEIVGFKIEKIGDVVTVEDSEVEPAPANVGGIKGEMLSGIIRDENRLYSVLNLDSLLAVD